MQDSKANGCSLKEPFLLDQSIAVLLELQITSDDTSDENGRGHFKICRITKRFSYPLLKRTPGQNELDPRAIMLVWCLLHTHQHIWPETLCSHIKQETAWVYRRGGGVLQGCFLTYRPTISWADWCGPPLGIWLVDHAWWIIESPPPTHTHTSADWQWLVEFVIVFVIILWQIRSASIYSEVASDVIRDSSTFNYGASAFHPETSRLFPERSLTQASLIYHS